MKNEVKTFRLFVRPDPKSQQIAESIRELNKKASIPLIESDDADLVVAIGGDGSFIDAVTSTNFSKKIIYTGIHTGTLGFLQDLCENDIYSLIQYINFEEEIKTRKVYTAAVKLFLKDNSIKSFFALNELLVAGNDFSKIHFKEYINENYLQDITGSGIIIATSTGDTAHSLNANGAIDLSNNRQLVRTLINPIRNAVYERFLDNTIICSKIALDILPSDNISIVIDGQKKNIDSHLIKKIEVSSDSKNFINKLDLKDYSKVRIIREKILGY